MDSMALLHSDGGRPGNVFWSILVGAFMGLFVAAPAFALQQNASFNEKVAQLMGEDGPEAVNLGDYLICEGVSLAAKFAAVMPQREDIYNLIACRDLFEKLQRTACNSHVGVSER
jgi:hypothetical protein